MAKPREFLFGFRQNFFKVVGIGQACLQSRNSFCNAQNLEHIDELQHQTFGPRKLPDSLILFDYMDLSSHDGLIQ